MEINDGENLLNRITVIPHLNDLQKPINNFATHIKFLLDMMNNSFEVT